MELVYSLIYEKYFDFYFNISGELFYSQEEEKRLAEERVKRRNDLLG